MAEDECKWRPDAGYRLLVGHMLRKMCNRSEIFLDGKAADVV
ncbi:MAG: hypothetical protein ACYSYV_02595 [Planctomycetota bacterium]